MVGTRDDEGGEGDLGAVFVAPGNDGELAGLLKFLFSFFIEPCNCRSSANREDRDCDATIRGLGK